MSRNKSSYLGAVLWIALLAAGCKREAPVNGIGGFEVGKTQLAQVGGRCVDASEPPLLFCPGLASVMLGEQRANIDLYFAGPKADDKLVEIVLDVFACRPDALGAWLTDKLGKPIGPAPEQAAQAAPSPGTAPASKRVFWTNEYVFISAGLPAEPGRCEVNFVAASDTKRIENLKKAASEQ